MNNPPKVTYEHRRLCFLAAVIEPLQPHEAFRVEANCGSFQMTKADFLRIFANVAASESYCVRGIYHYPHPPRKAEQFRVS